MILLSFPSKLYANIKSENVSKYSYLTDARCILGCQQYFKSQIKTNTSWFVGCNSRSEVTKNLFSPLWRLWCSCYVFTFAWAFKIFGRAKIRNWWLSDHNCVYFAQISIIFNFDPIAMKCICHSNNTPSDTLKNLTNVNLRILSSRYDFLVVYFFTYVSHKLHCGHPNAQLLNEFSEYFRYSHNSHRNLMR